MVPTTAIRIKRENKEKETKNKYQTGAICMELGSNNRSRVKLLKQKLDDPEDTGPAFKSITSDSLGYTDYQILE